MVSLNGKIDLLIVNAEDVATVRAVDYEQLPYAPAAITATATPAPPPAGQIMFTTTPTVTGAQFIQIGKDYNFTALIPGGDGHQFCKLPMPQTDGRISYLQPIDSREITGVWGLRYSNTIMPVWVLDPTAEVLSNNRNYYFEINGPWQYLGQPLLITASVLFPTGVTPTLASLVTQIAQQLNANPQFSEIATAVVVGTTVQITGTFADKVLLMGFPLIGYNSPNGFHQGVTTLTNTVPGSGPGIGTPDYMKNLVRRWKGTGVTTMTQLWEQEIDKLYSLFSSTGCYDIYHIVWNSSRNQQTMGLQSLSYRNETYIAIQRDPEDTSVPNSNASIMLVKTMLRNYFNTMYGFGLQADTAYDGITTASAVGIWGS
jgi:hypothetical protein